MADWFRYYPQEIINLDPFFSNGMSPLADIISTLHGMVLTKKLCCVGLSEDEALSTTLTPKLWTSNIDNNITEVIAEIATAYNFTIKDSTPKDYKSHQIETQMFVSIWLGTTFLTILSKEIKVLELYTMYSAGICATPIERYVDAHDSMIRLLHRTKLKASDYPELSEFTKCVICEKIDFVLRYLYANKN